MRLLSSTLTLLYIINHETKKISLPYKVYSKDQWNSHEAQQTYQYKPRTATRKASITYIIPQKGNNIHKWREN
jgi:hypothetical protein